MEKTYISLNWINAITIMVIVIVGHAVVSAISSFVLSRMGQKSAPEEANA